MSYIQFCMIDSCGEISRAQDIWTNANVAIRSEIGGQEHSRLPTYGVFVFFTRAFDSILRNHPKPHPFILPQIPHTSRSCQPSASGGGCQCCRRVEKARVVGEQRRLTGLDGTEEDVSRSVHHHFAQRLGFFLDADEQTRRHGQLASGGGCQGLNNAEDGGAASVAPRCGKVVVAVAVAVRDPMVAQTCSYGILGHGLVSWNLYYNLFPICLKNLFPGIYVPQSPFLLLLVSVV